MLYKNSTVVFDDTRVIDGTNFVLKKKLKLVIF